MGFSALPDGYLEVRTIDFLKNKKTMILAQVAALVVSIVLIIIGNVVKPFSLPNSGNFIVDILIIFAMLLLIVIYVVAHELVHAFFMKAFSKGKVNFGFNVLYAFVGSEAYFSKKQYIVISLAPIILLGFILLFLNMLVPVEWFWMIYILQITNISGAVGDIYMTALLCWLPADILVKDEGVKMMIYSRK